VRPFEPFVPHYDALLLANHGALTCGRICSPRSFELETIGTARKSRWPREMAGEPALLSSREVAKLWLRVRVTLFSPRRVRSGIAYHP